ncbi:MAG TPA: autotransporter outer membrane beta-barrel domain-containing protein [Alphaproteobacteria bacterium]
MVKRLLQLSCVAAVAAFAGTMTMSSSEALAQCTGTYGYTYSQCTSTQNSPGTAVVSSETVRIAVTQTAGILSDRVSQLISGQTQTAMNPSSRILSLGDSGNLNPQTGLGGRTGGSRIGAWVGGDYTHADFDKSVAEFHGHVWTGMAGVDFRLMNALVLGIAGGYEKQDFDTTFNRGNIEGTGWTIAPYAVLTINRMFSLDAAGGYSKLDYDMTRLDPANSARITGSTDASRYFATINGNGNMSIDRWRLGARVGTLYAHEDRDSFTESNGVTTGSQKTAIGFVNAGPRLGYMIGSLEPYVRAEGRVYYNDGGSDDRFDAVFAGGLRWNITPGASFNVEGSTVQFRNDMEQYGIGGALRVQF